MHLDPIALAGSCRDEGELEREVLGALERTIGFEAGFIAGLGDPPTTAGGLDGAALVGALGRHAYDDELLPVKRAALARRGVALDTDVYGAAGVRALRYFRDFALPVGGRCSLLAWMVLRGRPLGVMMLGRCGRPFSPSDVEAIEAILPALTVARASFRTPWTAPPLPEPPPDGLSSVAARALAWARGERVLARAGDGERQIVVRDRRGYREMVAVRPGAELVWSRARLDDPRRSGWFYVDLFHLAAARARHRRRALFIGSGGAVAVRQFAEVYPGIAIDLVDVEPRVLDLARDWYGLGSIPRLSVHVADGADLVARAGAARWDVVVVDAYDESDMPEHLASRAFFRDVGRSLAPGGAVAVNVIGALSLHDHGSLRAVERAMRRELDDVRLVPVVDPDEDYSPSALRNVVLLGSRRT